MKIEVLCDDVEEERRETELLQEQELERKKKALLEKNDVSNEAADTSVVTEQTSKADNGSCTSSDKVASSTRPTGTRATGSETVAQEESSDDDMPALEPVEPETEKTRDPVDAENPAKHLGGFKSGFLQGAEALYPDGSEQGTVTDKQKLKWKEKEMNDKMNAKLGFGGPDSEYPKPEWYTYDWPKNCQYNKPDCLLDPLSETKHASEMHKQVNRENVKWKEIMVEGKEMEEVRLCFLGLKDDDLEEVVNKVRDSTVIKSMDLSYNNFSDKGAQTLAGVLTNKGLPNLKELKVYNNQFTQLGECILSQGLKVLRKDLTVHITDPLEKFKKESAEAQNT